MRTDEKYKVPVLILDFDECANKFVRIWPSASLQRSQFLSLDRKPLPTPSPSENSGHESGYNTGF